jgi:hypothetical protein
MSHVLFTYFTHYELYAQQQSITVYLYTKSTNTYACTDLVFSPYRHPHPAEHALWSFVLICLGTTRVQKYSTCGAGQHVCPIAIGSSATRATQPAHACKHMHAFLSRFDSKSASVPFSRVGCGAAKPIASEIFGGIKLLPAGAFCARWESVSVHALPLFARLDRDFNTCWTLSTPSDCCCCALERKF